MSSDFPRSEANLSRLDGGAIVGARSGPDPDVPENDRYVPERLIGSGGMGQVWAVRDRRLSRVVALKEVGRGPKGEPRENAVTLEARLAREAWISGRLDHPGILPVHDLGTREDGSVFYAMPLVRGASLAERISSSGARERPLLLRRMLEACEAVAAAHREGVVHRDLKPANIMLVDGGGTRVVDWGLACLMDEPEDARRGVVGTRQYMSPEQRRGEPVDRRSDVWSLGATLCEMVAGGPVPGDFGADWRASEVARKLVGAPRELVAILKRALSAAPSARYPDAGAMAEDLARYLDGRKVEAYDYTSRELFVRFLRAWRVPLAVIALALAAIVVVVAVGVTRLRLERDRAVDAETFARTALAKSDRDLAHSLASQAQLSADHGSRADAEILAASALEWGESPTARGVLFGYSRVPRPMLTSTMLGLNCETVAFDEAKNEVACRTSDALELWALSPPRRIWHIDVKSKNMALSDDSVVFTNDRRLLVWVSRESGEPIMQLATGCGQYLLARGNRIVNADTNCFWAVNGMDGVQDWNHPCALGEYISAFALSDDGERWAAACSGGRVAVGDFGDGAPQDYPIPYENPHVLMALAFRGLDGLVVATNRGEVRVLDLESGQLGEVIYLGGEQVRSLSLNQAGALLIQSTVGAPTIIDITNGSVLTRMRDAPRGGMDWQGERLIEAEGARISTWEIPRMDASAFAVGAGVTSLDLDAREARLVISHADGISLRGLGSAVADVDIRGVGVIKSSIFAEDDFVIHSAVPGERSTHREVNVELGTDVTSPIEYLRSPGSRFHDGRRILEVDNGWLVVLGYSCGIRFGPPQQEMNSWVTSRCIPGRGPERGQLSRLDLESHRSRFTDGATNGRDVVLLENTADIIWWFSPLAMSLEPLFRAPGAVALSVAADLGAVAVVEGSAVSVWDGWTGELKQYLEAPGTSLLEVAISRDARWVAAGAMDGSLWLWDALSGALRVRLKAHGDRVSSLAFGTDGKLLVSGGWDGRVRLYDTTIIDLPAEGLVKDIEAAWGTDLRAVLARSGAPLE